VRLKGPEFNGFHGRIIKLRGENCDGKGKNELKIKKDFEKMKKGLIICYKY